VFHRKPLRDDQEEHAIFSLMRLDEFMSLLNYPGIVRVVSIKVRLDSEILAGMPWLLWNHQAAEPLAEGVDGASHIPQEDLQADSRHPLTRHDAMPRRPGEESRVRRARTSVELARVLWTPG
jgi:hypothetical protein